MTKEELDYNETMQNFNTSKEKINKAVEAYEKTYSDGRKDLGISEADYIRLTRVLQLAEKYLPKREIFSADQTETIRKQLIFTKIVEAYRSIKKRVASKKLQEEEISFPSSYTMAEELVGNMRNLRHYDYLLKHLNGESKQELEKILDKEPGGQIIRERSEGPGILDDYRQTNWGVERICLDGMQNHLPTDAKGTACWLHFEVDGKWVGVEEAKQFPEKISKVRFADDGVGFTPDNLLYLHSTKTSEKDSVGQFGEGMKLASMASINLGLGMELQSRNWSALAIGEEKNLINTRDNDSVEKRKKLVYQIKEYDGDPLMGSRTIFHTPTREFIDFALQLPEKVLELNANYRPLFSTDRGDIVSTSKEGQAFVKGVYVKPLNTLFSYNFDDANVSPDRNQITDFDVERAIMDILLRLNDKRIMKTLIAKMVDFHRENPPEVHRYNPIEIKFGENLFYAFKNNNGVPSLWREAFKEVLEQRAAKNADGTPIEAVLKTDYKVPMQLSRNLAKYNVVSLTNYWTLALQKAGIKTDRESLPEYIAETIPTSVSLEYGQEIWDNERMVLDTIQNHLPADCGGRNVFIRFQTSNGEWHDFSQFIQFSDVDIKKIKVSDDGNGYDVKSLGIFASAKDHDVSSGKWGEGLKMLAATSLRKGCKLELRSRDWMAMPRTQHITLNKGEVNEKQVEQLVFETITKINSGSTILNDGDNPQNRDQGYYKNEEKSSSTFIDPSPELIREFRNVKEKVLVLQKRSAVARVNGSEVLDFSSGKLFIRDIKIPGEHNIKYGYHFRNFDIETRDRNSIKNESLQERLREIFEHVEEERFVSSFLKDAAAYAQEAGTTKYLEFTTPFCIPYESYQADTWIKVFKQDFGEKTAIRRSTDQDMNAVHRAQHLDIGMVTLPDDVARALINLKGRDGQVIPSYENQLAKCLDNVIPVPEKDLTDYEKYMLEHLHNYNQILGSSGQEKPIQNISVYRYDEKYDGPRASGYAGKGNSVSINQDTLNGDLCRLGDVFFHEADHALTGAEDAASIFRDYLTSLLSGIAMETIPIDKDLRTKLATEARVVKQEILKQQSNQTEIMRPIYADGEEFTGGKTI